MKNKISFNLPILLTIVISLSFFACNNSNNKNTELKRIIKSDTVKYPPQKTGKILKKFPPSKINPDRITITKIDIKPELPFVNSVLTFDIFLKTKLKKIKPYFIYYINNRKVKETYENTLSGLFKKNDFVYADIILLKDGKEVKRVRSDIIKILNSNPVIENISFSKIIIPGEYSIKLSVRDDDEDDNDSLNISLKSTGDMPSFNINQDDKIIILNLTKDDFGKIYKFFIKVEDKDGGYSERELTLNLLKKKITEKVPKKVKPKKENKKNQNKNEGIGIKEINIGGIGD